MYVIVTARSLLWMLLTLAATLAVLSALLTPRWLVGPPRTRSSENGTVVYSPTVGVYNRCVRLHGRQSCGPFAAHGLATDPQVFPPCWKAALVLLAAGLAIMALTVLSAILSSCVQSICRKSIFTLSGAAQAIAGIFFILGITLHPAGWGSPRVQKLCGYEAAPFYLAECSLGWAFYSAVGGVVLTFLCSVLSMQAELATSSDKVQYQIHQGRTLVCLP